MGTISNFIEANYKHFNARELVDSARAYKKFIAEGGKMLVSLAGAMSTGELGISLAKMIRAGKVHIISCTGANLEEDLFNLVGNKTYKMLPNYRDLTPQDEVELRDAGFSRVTDTCISEEAWLFIADKFMEYAAEAANNGEAFFPYQYFYRMIREGVVDNHMQVPRENSWMIAACEMGIPIVSPGWEDSTLGNIFAANVFEKKIKTHNAVHGGTEQFEFMLRWYLENDQKYRLGFFQIGGGIAGDFPICVTPSIRNDLRRECKSWQYFSQISDSTTSYGSYSGAVPNEKISWNKLDADTPKFMIESDASIVAPLIFAYVLDE